MEKKNLRSSNREGKKYAKSPIPNQEKTWDAKQSSSKENQRYSPKWKNDYSRKPAPKVYRINYETGDSEPEDSEIEKNQNFR